MPVQFYAAGFPPLFNVVLVGFVDFLGDSGDFCGAVNSDKGGS